MTSTPKPDDKLKLLVYGRPGCGKTYLMGTGAGDKRLGRCLMLEAKGNPISLRKMKVKPDIISIHSMQDFNAPYRWLSDGQDPDDPFCKEFELEPPYSTLLIDGLTEVQRQMVRRITGVVDMMPGELTPPLGRQGFGSLLGSMLNWAVKFFDLAETTIWGDRAVNIMISSHEATSTDDKQVVSIKPLIWGQSGDEIAGYAYMVMRLSTRMQVDGDIKAENPDVIKPDVFNVGQVWPTTKTYAKDQYQTGVTHIINPSMERILDLIELGSQ